MVLPQDEQPSLAVPLPDLSSPPRCASGDARIPEQSSVETDTAEEDRVCSRLAAHLEERLQGAVCAMTAHLEVSVERRVHESHDAIATRIDDVIAAHIDRACAVLARAATPQSDSRESATIAAGKLAERLHSEDRPSSGGAQQPATQAVNTSVAHVERELSNAVKALERMQTEYTSLNTRQEELEGLVVRMATSTARDNAAARAETVTELRSLGGSVRLALDRVEEDIAALKTKTAASPLGRDEIAEWIRAELSVPLSASSLRPPVTAFSAPSPSSETSTTAHAPVVGSTPDTMRSHAAPSVPVSGPVCNLEAPPAISRQSLSTGAPTSTTPSASRALMCTLAPAPDPELHMRVMPEPVPSRSRGMLSFDQGKGTAPIRDGHIDNDSASHGSDVIVGPQTTEASGCQRQLSPSEATDAPRDDIGTRLSSVTATPCSSPLQSTRASTRVAAGGGVDATAAAVAAAAALATHGDAARRRQTAPVRALPDDAARQAGPQRNSAVASLAEWLADASARGQQPVPTRELIRAAAQELVSIKREEGSGGESMAADADGPDMAGVLAALDAAHMEQAMPVRPEMHTEE
eukprot:gnl/TRDRNA2_/TRDRNA2_55211_c0_seq1.p1 gnl/TRDRNA2_/TRDRNA2_55211_c0~~gnl/TRDRNA2_/TRDRNA2_55211_c0_seq1.p1  ORF type:complete len:581 (-),score=105.41 gnl/TRDRNA2_/TRDRNA2_55211_c0_seq1:73-1815(-)